MCTDLRLVRLNDHHISARTLDFTYELNSRVHAIPQGQRWHAAATKTHTASLDWRNHLGFIAMDGFGLDDYFCDGLNEAGLSVATLWLPETHLPTEPPNDASVTAIDFPSLAGWLLGTCTTVSEVRQALESVSIWNPKVGRLWPSGRETPANMKDFMDSALPEHLACHDASGSDLVVEFLEDGMHFHENPSGVLTNSPPFPWHQTNLRNYVGLSSREQTPVNLMGQEVQPTGNGSGLLGMPGDVTPPSRFIRATVLSEVVTQANDAQDAANQAFHALDLCSVPRGLLSSGDYTQWYTVRDHDRGRYYVRSYQGWHTDTHDIDLLGVNRYGTRQAFPLPGPPLG